MYDEPLLVYDYLDTFEFWNIRLNLFDENAVAEAILCHPA